MIPEYYPAADALAGARITAEAPRSARRLIADTVALYRRYPLLFLMLAAAVIVPYELIVLLATGAGPFEVEETSRRLRCWVSPTWC